MNNQSVTCGADYALILISAILEAQNEVNEEHKLHSSMLISLTKRIHDYANFAWKEYTEGTRESYLFFEDEMLAIYEKAAEDAVASLLEGLVEKEMVSIAGINENGEFLYSLTEKGKEVKSTIEMEASIKLKR